MMVPKSNALHPGGMLISRVDTAPAVPNGR